MRPLVPLRRPSPSPARSGAPRRPARPASTRSRPYADLHARSPETTARPRPHASTSRAHRRPRPLVCRWGPGRPGGLRRHGLHHGRLADRRRRRRGARRAHRRRRAGRRVRGRRGARGPRVVVTPGLVDVRSTVGLSGLLNQPQDQDALDTGSALQPSLRALDAYNARDELVAWLLALGVTTVHTGHAPGAIAAGQTTVVKTAYPTLDAALVDSTTMMAMTIGPSSVRPSTIRGRARASSPGCGGALRRAGATSRSGRATSRRRATSTRRRRPRGDRPDAGARRRRTARGHPVGAPPRARVPTSTWPC